MTNTEIRAWYRQKVGEIPRLNNEWTEQGYRLEERARRAWRIRHEARNQARSMMENSDEVEDLMERDRRLCGHSDGPTFEQLVAVHRRNGLEGDEVDRGIIVGAQRTKRDTDDR